MKAIKTLLWLEWKNSSQLTTALAVILLSAIGLFLSINGDTSYKTFFYRSALLTGTMSVGAALLGMMCVKMRKSLFEAKLSPLIIAPIPIYFHIASKVIYVTSVGGIFALGHIGLIGIMMDDFYIKYDEIVSSLSFVYFFFLFVVIFPFVSWVGFVGAIPSAFKKRSTATLATITLVLATFISIPTIFDIFEDSKNKILPAYVFEPPTVPIEKLLLKWQKEAEGVGDSFDADETDIRFSYQRIEPFHIAIEPIIIMILLAFALSALSGRAMSEMEA